MVVPTTMWTVFLRHIYLTYYTNSIVLGNNKRDTIPFKQACMVPCGNNSGYLGRVLPVRSHVGTMRAGLTQMGPCWEAAELNHDGLARMGTSWVPYGLSI
jgi:hypothetical protein